MESAKTYAVQDQKAISETLDGETIIINLETGSYYSMNADGTAVWNAIKKRELIDGSSEKSIRDFISFLEREDLVAETESTPDAVLADLNSAQNPHIEKYTDMQEMLLADPIHDVDQAGWPHMKKED